MNRIHHWLCRSAHWQKTLEHRVPWVISETDLGSNLLELGPGPGLTTDILRSRVQHITAIELDTKAAVALRSRLRETNVDVFEGDATAMLFPDACFSACVSFTMLHHVPSRQLQDKLLREVRRVLMPGAAFVGSDSLQSVFMRLIHIGDTLVPVDPATFGSRLEAAGFNVIAIEKGVDAFRFHAQRPCA